MEKVYLTEDGLKKLKEELNELYKKRTKIAEVIEYARSLGDLSENAEYQTAKEEQAVLMAKIRDLEGKIARAVILKKEDINTSVVSVGTRIRVLNQKTKKEQIFTMVSDAESDINLGKLSTKSPVGRALLGKRPGDEVEVQVPAGKVVYKVLEILPSE
ncbi:MAG: transcription elongation factor GreA [Candidatus Hydrogenedentes bacterium]|nr:transcription elongation factor GreA [Candidatus Hydrogenedentota bacterium]